MKIRKIKTTICNRIKSHKIISLIAALIVLLAVVGYVAYQKNHQFHEESDEIYYSTYYNLFIDPTMSGIADIKANIAYCDTTDRQQKLDVYMPKNSESPLPVAVYIHGGGWSTGDKANPFVADYGAEVVKAKMAFVSINYRLAPDYHYPAQNQDVACAMNYLITHAKDLNLDMTKVGLLGDSAGGHLAAMEALSTPHQAQVKAVVEFYGPSDIWAQITRKPSSDQWAVNYIGSSTDQSLADKASPLYADYTNAPPFLLLHGTNDQTVHYDESVQFAAKLQKAGVNVTLVPVSNANHYFSQKSRPTINEIEKQVVGFLGGYLLGGQ